MNKKLSQILLALSVLLFLSAAYFLIADVTALGGQLLIIGFITLALGVRGF